VLIISSICLLHQILIKHPKGNVLFDTGNNDKIITDPTYWGPLATALEPSRSPDVAIDAQLDKIGVKHADINYVVLGHMHLDHAANVGKFPSATIVYQRHEIVNAFWPKPGFGCCYITGDFSMLRNDVGENSPNRQKVIELTLPRCRIPILTVAGLIEIAALQLRQSSRRHSASAHL
jgi:N-acyl homoserine lactone hydrolase